MLTPLLLLAALGVARGAEADPESWVGVPVQSVQVVSPRGGVPEESLDPLLRVRQGVALDPGMVRLDLATLFHAGEFAAVEAEVEPWVGYGPDGEPFQAVLLRYNVYPAPRVGRVRVQGAEGLSPSKVLDAAALGVGDAIYPEVDTPRVAARVADRYRRGGYLDAQVEVDAYGYTERRLFGAPEERTEIWIRVAEGQPRTIERLVFTGEVPVTERRLRRLARRAGIREGEPFTPEAIKSAQLAMRADLASGARFFGLRRNSWVEARVTPAISGEQGDLQLVYHVEPGPELLLDVHGLWPWPRRKVRSALALDDRTRLTRGFLEQAPDTLETYMQRRGYRDAEAAVALDARADEDAAQVLSIDVRRGARHMLTRPFDVSLTSLPQHIDFVGNEALSDERLKTVMVQASEEVLRYGYLTDTEVDKGLSAARDVYRAHGYQEARLQAATVHERRRWFSLWHLPLIGAFGRALGIEPTIDVTLVVHVDEGPLTRLRELAITGAAPGVELGFAEDERGALEGSPYSPLALEQLARRVVLAHRDGGWLEADARVVSTRAEDGAVRATIEVDAGPRVLLRSFVATGARQTRPEFIRRQVDLALGEPITQRDLEETRRRLYGLGVFRTVQTELIGDGSARDLLVELRERPRYSFELGSGVSTDQGLRGFGRVTRHNVWGLAHRWELFGLVGLDYRSDAVTDWWFDVKDPEWRAAATYTAPHFPGRQQQLVFDVLLREQVQERTWRMARSGIGAAIESRHGRTTLRGGVRTETRRLLEVDTGAILPGEPWAELFDSKGFPLPSAWREQHTASLLALHDRRDDPFQPTRGVLFSVLGEYSPGLGSQLWDNVLPPVAYIEGEAHASGYLPLGPLTLHVSGEAARALPLGGGMLALEDRYRLGGTGSMRGYKRDEIGPRNEVAQVDVDWPDALDPVVGQTIRDDPTRWVSTGGDTRAQGTLELLTPLSVLGLHGWDGYALAVYADVGNVWLLGGTATSEFPQYDAIFDPLLRYGLGAGFRVGTPVGPLQIDIASNPEAMFAEGARWRLLRDEWNEPAWRAHLSLGTLF